MHGCRGLKRRTRKAPKDAYFLFRGKGHSMGIAQEACALHERLGDFFKKKLIYDDKYLNKNKL